MLRRSLLRPALAVLVATVGLVVGPGVALAGPLDHRYTQRQVEQWLYIEIADIFERYREDQDYDDEELVAAIMDALADAPRAGMSERHRQVHGYVTRRDLEAEMNEADTTLLNVVRESVYEADAMGLLLDDNDDRDGRQARPVHARWDGEPRTGAGATRADLQLAQQGDLSGRDGRAKPGKAGRQAARNISAVAFGR
jgi:hypothetical protein